MTWTGRCKTRGCPERGKLFHAPDGKFMLLKHAACPACRKPLARTSLSLIAAPSWSTLKPVRARPPVVSTRGSRVQYACTLTQLARCACSIVGAWSVSCAELETTG